MRGKRIKNLLRPSRILLALSLSLFLRVRGEGGARGLKNKIQEKVCGEKEAGYVPALRERGKFTTDDE